MASDRDDQTMRGRYRGRFRIPGAESISSLIEQRRFSVAGPNTIYIYTIVIYTRYIYILIYSRPTGTYLAGFVFVFVLNKNQFLPTKPPRHYFLIANRNLAPPGNQPLVTAISDSENQRDSTIGPFSIYESSYCSSTRRNSRATTAKPVTPGRRQRSRYGRGKRGGKRGPE